ncbi:uncharacterized protein LOC133475722 isoform X2 [Phyllopteryx taeniolatus]|uniref:uncharacterized protein LOC133475722 isoform X2 n=1 Tax=Phyllopteryx taeniolatus TaxID=161469 RepID=UPI002AD25A61|nr:uncharacterized protein LOC133475722 isoform X2 [Phyllopteryx taeniolatus]
MDQLTVNKSQGWASQTGWSVASTQGPLLNSFSCRDPSALYGHQQAAGDSFLRTLASMSHIHSHVSPASLFASAPFDPLQPADARGKLGPLQAVHQAQLTTPCAPPSCAPLSCAPAPCSPRSPHRPSFQLPPSPCSFQSVYEMSASHSQTSSAPPVVAQWIDSSHSNALNDSSHPNTDGLILTPAVTKRSMVLHQRSLLLKQLSELDKLLESLPPEDDVGVKLPHSAAQLESQPPEDGVAVKSPHSAVQSPLSMEESAPCQSVTPHKVEPQWYASSDGPSLPPQLSPPPQLSRPPQLSPLPEPSPPPQLSQPPQPSHDEHHEDDDDDNLTDDSEKQFVESSDEGDPAFSPSDDGDMSDALSDFGDDDIPPSSGSPHSPDRRMSLRNKKPFLESLRTESREAKTEWSRLKNVKVSAMKQGRKSCKRVYRRNYCLFCSKPLVKMSKHLQRQHSHKDEVAAALRFPKGSRERYKVWNRLINEGNFEHNKQVLRTGEGQLAARKRPLTTGQAQDFLHCLYCRGLYMKKNLAGHMKRCPERKKKDDKPRVGQERVETRCALEVMGNLGISTDFHAILSQMIYDDVTRLIISEPVLLSYGEDMLAQHGTDGKRQEYMRQNLRLMARLVLEAWKRTPLKRLEDFFLPDNFPHVVAAVNVLAGYDSTGCTYSTPSLAIKLGYSLQKVCHIVQERAIERGDTNLAESAKTFMVVYRKQWNKMISSNALSALRKTKRNSREKVPDVQDVKKLSFHVEKVHLLAEGKLRAAPSAETYGALARAILARIVLFNRRQSSELSTIPLTALKSVKKPNPQENLDIFVCELERSMCRVLNRMEIRATCGRMVPVLLKPAFLSTLELLVGVREACGVPANNPFLFGRPHTLSAYRGSKCVQMFVKDSVPGEPDVLTSVSIRRHYATMLQLINLNPMEAELILGPNNQVQSLRENIGVELKDIGMDPEGLNAAPLQCGGARPVASWEHCESASGLSGTHVTNSTAPQEGASKVNSTISKHKWSDCEVSAVERHMMSFIRDHKVPQKLDCLRCLDAEPRALGTRSWKGVKDYVRNRITALKRQSKPS